MGETISYNLEVEKILWSNFKKTMTKDDIINKILIEMIKKRIEEFKNI